MVVDIWDMDFYYKKNCINPLAMRTSSFCKQRGDTVVLIARPEDLKTKFDQMYVFKQDKEIENPPINYIANDNVRLNGHGFGYLRNWVPNRAILACRPDYLLYPQLGIKYQNDDLLQFSDYNNRLLQKYQNPRNAYRIKNSVIVDENLWDLSTEDLKTIFTYLKYRKNIDFFWPISLRRVLCDKTIREIFIHLKYKPGVKLIWKNSFPLNTETVKDLMEFFKEFKKYNKNVFIGEVAFQVLNNKPTFDNLIDALSLVEEKKTTHIDIKLLKPVSRCETAYNHIFETLVDWNNTDWNLSFIEFIALGGEHYYNCGLQEYYLKEKYWTNESFRAAIGFIRKYNEVYKNIDVFFHQMDDKYLDRNMISLKFLKENVWF